MWAVGSRPTPLRLMEKERARHAGLFFIPRRGVSGATRVGKG